MELDTRGILRVSVSDELSPPPESAGAKLKAIRSHNHSLIRKLKCIVPFIFIVAEKQRHRSPSR